MTITGLTTVVFDLDGTLCRYKITTAEALAATLDHAGLPPDALGDLATAATRYLELWHAEEQLESTLPFRTRIWTRLLAEHGINDPALASRLGDVYVKVRLPTLYLVPGTLQLLTALRPRFRLGLLTNGPREIQWPKIEWLNLGKYFDAITVAGDVGIYKPDPRVFAVALAQLGQPPHRAVYIGDSYQMDVVGAKRAGLHCVWLRHPEHDEPMDSIRPDAEIDDLTRLPEVL